MPVKEKSKTPFASFELASYHIFSDDLALIDYDNRAIINTINPHSFYIAENDGKFRKALENADLLMPDGIGIVWACRFLNRRSIRRISGMDVFQYLLETAAAQADPRKRRIFFLGASQQTLEKIRKRIQKEYPNLEMGSHSPPFKEVFSVQDNEIITRTIREFDPHVLFVGMTAPKQEKWVYDNQNELKATIICSIGAVFDYYAGTIKRPGPFWRRIGLEWFIRFLREPKRLWKRNLISGPFFIFRIFQLKLNS